MYCLRNSRWAGDILPGVVCHYLPRVRETRRALPATQLSCPPGLEAPHSAQEQVSSRVVHMGGAAEGDVPLRSEESVNHSEEGHSGSYTGNQLPSPSASLSTVSTTEVQNICNQRHGRVVLSLARELALDHNFLVAWYVLIEETRMRDSLQPSVPCMARHSGPPIDDALVIRTRKEITNRGRWRRPHKPFHRPASTLPSLRPEMRKRVAQSDFSFGESVPAQASAWRLFRGVVPRRL